MVPHVHSPMVLSKTDQDAVQLTVHGDLGQLELVPSHVQLLVMVLHSSMVLKSILVLELVLKPHVILLPLKIKLFLAPLSVELIVIGHLGLPTPPVLPHVVEVLYTEPELKTSPLMEVYHVKELPTRLSPVTHSTMFR